MADDNIERIRIEIDDADAAKASQRVNAGLDSMETKAGEVSAAISQTTDTTARKILSVTQTSQNQINRIVATAERKAAFATASPIQRLDIERKAALVRVGGDEQAVNRVTAAYGRLKLAQAETDKAELLGRAIASIKVGEAAANKFTLALSRLNREQAQARKADYETSLNAAIKASQRANVEAEKFNQTLLRVNRTARDGVADLQKRAAITGKTGLDKLEIERQQALSKFGNSPANQAAINASFDKLKSVQIQNDYNASLQRAVAASQRATADSDKFAGALARLNRQKQQSIELDARQRQSTVADAVRKAASPIERIAIDRVAALDKVGNDPNARATVNASFDKLRQAEFTKQYEASLNRAIAASKRAEVESDRFAAALSRVNRQKAIAIELDTKTRISTVTDAVRRAATPRERVEIDRASALSKVGNDKQAQAIINSSFDKLAETAAISGKSFGQRVQDFFANPIRAIGNELSTVGGSFSKFGLLAGGAFIAVGLAAREAFSIFSDAARAGKDTEQLASRLGVTTQEALKLDAMAKISRVDISAFEFSMRRLSQALVDGGEEGKRGAKALEDIGVHSRESNGDLKGTYTLFTQIGNAISGLSAPERTAKLAAIFGRGAITLEPMIAHFHELDTLLDGIGIKLDDNLVKQLSDADTKIAVLGVEWDRMKAKFAEKLYVLVEFLVKGDGNEFGVSPATPGSWDHFMSGLFASKTARDIAIDVVPKLKLKTDAAGNDNFLGQAVGITSHRLEQQSIAAGDSLLAAFRARADTAAALQAEVTRLEGKTREDEAKLQPGLHPDIQQGFINTVQADRVATEAAKERLKLYNEIPNRIKQAGEFADASARLEHTGVARVLDDYRQKYLELTKDIGAGKALIEINAQLSRGANVQIGQEAYKEQRKAAAESQKLTAEQNARDNSYQEAKFSRSQTFEAETLKLRQDTIASQFSYEDTIASQSRDSQLRAIEITDAKTLQQKVGFEITKGKIEADYIKTRYTIQVEALERQSASELGLLQSSLAARAITQSEFDARSLAITGKTVEAERQLKLSATADVLKVQQDAAIKAADAVRDANTRVFDSFKHESEGIFDAMTRNGQNAFQALGNALKNALLTTLKDIVSTRVAQGLTGLFTGQTVGLTPATVGSGPLAKIGAVLGIGSRPTFGTVQSKIDQVGHIGDVQTISSPVGNAVPVHIVNPESIQQKVDVKSNATSTQVNQQVTVGGSSTGNGIGSIGGGGIVGVGAGRVPLGALLTVLAASAAQSIPGGYNAAPTGTGSAVSTAIAYENGPQQYLGEKITRFGDTGTGNDGGSGGGFGPGAGSNSISDLLSGSANAFTGGSVDANGIPVGSANQRLSQLLSQTGFAGVGATPTGTGTGTNGLSSLFKSGVGGIKSLLGLDSSTGTLLTPSYGLGTASLAGKVAGVAASPLATTLGLGLFSTATKNPYGKGAPIGASVGGGLAGFGIGSKIPGVGGIYGAEIGAGVGLLVNGLQRGGIGGFAEDIAGGAVAGFGVAGPIGAAVGAGVGAILGGLSLAGILKTKNQKFHDKIKAIYGVNITDNGLLSQFTQIANSKYGGNVDVAVRSVEVRQLVQLWAQAHGQNSLGIVGTPQQSIFSNTGSKLTQVPTYFDGQGVLPGQTQSRVGIPQITPSGGYITIPNPSGANTGGASSTFLQLDREATTAVLQGQAAQVINNQPRLISQQTQAGMNASSARRDIASSVLQPAFLTT